jgi:Ca2+-binding RTX toxin-like protein
VRGAPVTDRCDIGAIELVYCEGIPVKMVLDQAGEVLSGFISGLNTAVLLLGGDNEYTVFSSATVCAGDGKDVITSGPAPVAIYGELGRDRLAGGPRSDRLSGGPANDRLKGGKGGDRLVGGPGKDLLVGGPGKDRCAGGPGKDKLIGCENGSGKRKKR